MDQDKCEFLQSHPISLYVDDFVYFSESDKNEEWLFVNSNNLKSHVKADFIGDVQWFLCQYDEWSSDNNGKVSQKKSLYSFKSS